MHEAPHDGEAGDVVAGFVVLAGEVGAVAPPVGAGDAGHGVAVHVAALLQPPVERGDGGDVRGDGGGFDGPVVGAGPVGLPGRSPEEGTGVDVAAGQAPLPSVAGGAEVAALEALHIDVLLQVEVGEFGDEDVAPHAREALQDAYAGADGAGALVLGLHVAPPRFQEFPVVAPRPRRPRGYALELGQPRHGPPSRSSRRCMRRSSMRCNRSSNSRFSPQSR